jgi:hypothetical protein
MPIPKTRTELVHQVTDAYAKLHDELEKAGAAAAKLPCVDDWTVGDLLAVRVWWTEHVIEWIEAGRRGETPVTPAPGYQWRETPRLNADIVRAERRTSFAALRQRLDRGAKQALATIDTLTDRELFTVGAFPWTGTLPLSRWISINTARQYTTARTYIRRAVGRKK